MYGYKKSSESCNKISKIGAYIWSSQLLCTGIQNPGYFFVYFKWKVIIVLGNHFNS